MVDSLKNLISECMKGGTCYLLLYLYCLHFSLAQEIAFQDQGEKDFGKVSILMGDKKVLDFLEMHTLSFEEWTSFFSVSVKGSNRSIIGDYFLENGQMAFKPRFLPDPTIVYRVDFSANELYSLSQIDADLTDLTKEIQFKSFDLGTTKVIEIFPGTDMMPENTLRLYLNFH